MASVSIQKIHKHYADFHAVKGVSLEIKDKEFVVLVGPSGCGKTTTLRMVAGLETITEGQILIGQPGGQRPAADGSRHRHGVPELRALSSHERFSTTWRSA